MNLLVRSSSENKQLHVFDVNTTENDKTMIAIINHDFILTKKDKLPLVVDIVDVDNKKIGTIETFFEKDNKIKVFDKKGKRIRREEKPEIQCFEKNNEIAGLVMDCNEKDWVEALSTVLETILNKRIGEQEMLKRLLI